jgi:hypothetical protein
MSNFHNIDGKKIPFTMEEERQQDLKEKVNKRNMLMKKWIDNMKMTDVTLMSRFLEEHIIHDHGGITKSRKLTKSLQLKLLMRKNKPTS